MKEGKAVEAAGDWCQFVKGLNRHGFRTGQVYKPRPDLHKASQPGMTVESHPSPTAPEADIKTFPSPPTTERTDGYIEERVFANFQNFREPRFKMSEPEFWVLSPPSGKGVNTRTDNLRVHTAGSNTRTTSVGTTALSHNIVFICGDINALGWDPRVLFWENFRLWRPNRVFRVAGVA